MKSPLYIFPSLYEKLIPFHHGHAYKERMFLIKLLLKGKRILELGCGTGINSIFLDGDYYGFDANEEFIKYGKKKGRNINYGNIYNIPLKNCDAILIVDVLHHLPDHCKLLKKIVSTGKEVVVCEPFNHKPKSKLIGCIYSKIGELLDSDGINKPVHWYNKSELKRFFNELGKCNISIVGEDLVAHYPTRR